MAIFNSYVKLPEGRLTMPKPTTMEKNLVREFAAFSVYSRGELSGDGPLTLAIDGDTAIFGSRTSLTLGLVNIFGRNLQHDRTCLCHQSENR